MSAQLPVIPPFDRMFLTGIWIETLLYGMNCIIFAGALYVLFRRSRHGTPPRFFITVSCWLFLLSTAHIALGLHQLLAAFIYGPLVPGAASIYFVNPANPEYVVKLVIYTTTIFSQDLVLIWRLWILYSKNWRIVILPLIVEAVHIAFGYICCARAAAGATVADNLTHVATLVTWILDLAVNVGVTSLIVYKLHSAGNIMHKMGIIEKNKYTSTILTVIESGMILASAIIIMVGMFLANLNATVAAVDVVVQVATLTPLLIIVRVGFGLTHGEKTSVNALAFNTGSTGSTVGRSMPDRPAVHVKTSIEYELSPPQMDKKDSSYV